MLLVLVIYYLVSLSSSLREAVTDLRTQLREERDAGRRNHRRQQDAAAPSDDPNGCNPLTGKIIAQWRKAVPLNANAKAAVAKVSQTVLAENAAAFLAARNFKTKSKG